MNEWMKFIISSNNGILLSNKKEETTDTNNMDESEETLFWVKEARYKKEHAVWFQLYEILEKNL